MMSLRMIITLLKCLHTMLSAVIAEINRIPVVVLVPYFLRVGSKFEQEICPSRLISLEIDNNEIDEAKLSLGEVFRKSVQLYKLPHIPAVKTLHSTSARLMPNVFT